MSEMTTLVATQSVAKLTANCETDAHTALTRGLQEYMLSITALPPGGRQVPFKEVFNTWAETEEIAEYPSAVVYVPDEFGEYDSSRLAPTLDPNNLVAPNTYAYSPTEFVTGLKAEIWCTDHIERRAFVKACEDAFNPVDWMYGFVLQLPHYYNQRGQYEILKMKYEDSEIRVTQRYRVASFEFKAQVPVTRLIVKPTMKIQIRPSIQIGVGPASS